MATMDSLRQTLQERLDRHVAELSVLTDHDGDLGQHGLDPDTARSITDAKRQAVADTTAALRRMADGTYGRCARCQSDIAIERLEIRPHAQFCVPCQRDQHG
jgi:DnaK suppressor protein